jgi:preprotein translocase subunit SecD
MFTAILGTRALVNLAYGGRRVERLSIGRVKMKPAATTAPTNAESTV